MVPLADWEHLVRVNMWGVIYGCLSFIPKMLKQGTESHILNTASLAGLIKGSGSPVYSMTKHAVVSLSESVSEQLAAIGSQIKVSVLCPGFVATSAVDSALKGWAPKDSKQRDHAAQVKEKMNSATDPAEIAHAVFRALRAEQFYILPHVESRQGVQARFEGIIAAYTDQ